MRPQSLEEFAGQDHIVGPGRLLRRAIQADQLSSLIFYGPPGTGKTTLARIIANSTQSRFSALNAVLSGVKDVREAISRAGDARDLHDRRTLLFVDEVHRWNKAQQDALLPWVENGTVVLIGATTENPYFEVIPALVSRSRVFQLKTLSFQDLEKVARSAVAHKERGYGRWSVSFAPGALEHLVRVSAGDARSLLNALQLAVETTPASFPPPEGTSLTITLEAAEESIQRQALLYDKEGDYHFDTISAFIKSLRGSDPDAALYWLALMIRGGEDPRFILRRMLISASEDVGLADPQALVVVEAAAAAFDRIGLPEGQYPLAQAALYLATCPKSNSVLGYFDALKVLDEEKTQTVPSHLKDASRDKKAFGHGEGYRYPHAWRDHWVPQQYLPDGLAGRIFYRPADQGYEGRRRQEILSRREAQAAAMLEEDQDFPGEVFTYSPGDSQREAWARRTERGMDSLTLQIREALFSRLKLLRHERILVAADPGGSLIWEAHRQVPEGGAALLCPSPRVFDALSWLAGGLPSPERPRLLSGELDSREIQAQLQEGGTAYEAVAGRHLLTRELQAPRRLALLTQARQLAAPQGRLLLAEARPWESSRLGEILPPPFLQSPLGKAFLEAEDALLKDMKKDLDPSDLVSLTGEAGWEGGEINSLLFKEERILTPRLLEGWFRQEKPGGYGSRMARLLGPPEWENLCRELLPALQNQRVPWTTALSFLQALCP